MDFTFLQNEILLALPPILLAGSYIVIVEFRRKLFGWFIRLFLD